VATFASIDQLAVYSQSSPSGADLARLGFALDVATSLIQNYTGQTIFLVEDDVVTLYPCNHRVLLPELPVVAVASVTSDGDAVDHTLRSSGVLELDGSWSTSIEVTYDHGYETIPYAIVMACVELANGISTPVTSGVSSETEAIDDYRRTVTYAGSSSVGMSLSVQAMLDPYRIKALV
jgi:hypothetical protein